MSAAQTSRLNKLPNVFFYVRKRNRVELWYVPQKDQQILRKCRKNGGLRQYFGAVATIFEGTCDSKNGVL